MKLNMKNRHLLIALCVTALTAVNAVAGQGLLSPRAAANQSVGVSGYNSDPDLTTGQSSLTPHLQDAQVKTVSGKSTQVTPSLTCARRMSGSPKMIGNCAMQSTDSMSCCSDSSTK